MTTRRHVVDRSDPRGQREVPAGAHLLLLDACAQCCFCAGLPAGQKEKMLSRDVKQQRRIFVHV
jgi:hypothetical protein